jgi:hypothetical protein
MYLLDLKRNNAYSSNKDFDATKYEVVLFYLADIFFKFG